VIAQQPPSTTSSAAAALDPRQERLLETEIIDALHESWDDSNILRRDALLAKCVLSVRSCTLRLLEQTTNSLGESITKACDECTVCTRAYTHAGVGGGIESDKHRATFITALQYDRHKAHCVRFECSFGDFKKYR
jgi:hypothetical protein